MQKKILCKVTSRSRPEHLIKAVKSYKDKALNPDSLIWLFTFDSDDEKYNSISFTDSLANIVPGCFIYFDKSEGKIDAINRDISNHSDWDILINISDDQNCELQDWDKYISDLMPNDLDVSIWASDGSQPRINTQEIIGRNYYLRFNYIYNPEYKSLFCDNEATEVAEILNKQIKTEQIISKHYHPCATKDTHMVYDELYKRNEKYWSEDEATYNRRKRINFGL